MSLANATRNELIATVRQCVIFADARTLAPPISNPAYLVGPEVVTLSERPLVAWLIREMARFGGSDFVILVDLPVQRMSDIRESLLRHIPQTVTLRSIATEGVTDRDDILRANLDILAERFWLCGGDTVFTGNLALLLKDAVDDPECVMARALLEPEVANTPESHLRDTGVELIAAVQQKPIDFFTGVTLMKRKLLGGPINTALVEQHLSARLAAGDQLRVSYIAGRFSNLAAFVDHELYGRLFRRPALFLDRDGVINVDVGWVGSRDRFTWTPGALDAVRLANNLGWHVFVVTNQSGVARGFYSEADVHALHAWMLSELHSFGATIDDIRYCPYHPQAIVEKYRAVSEWRKPGSGMIRDLIRTWDLDPKRCALIGDQSTDVLAANGGGIDGYLFPGGDLAEFVNTILNNPKYCSV